MVAPVRSKGGEQDHEERVKDERADNGTDAAENQFLESDFVHGVWKKENPGKQSRPGFEFRSSMVLKDLGWSLSDAAAVRQ